jgi:ketosteroid isomerase-like protein
MSQENVELIRKANEAWSADPLKPPFEYFDPEIERETRWPGLPQWFRGHDGIKEWIERALEPMDLAMDLVDARSLDHETVFVEYRVRGRGRGSGGGAEMPVFDLYWFRNGLIYRRRAFRSEAAALEAAGLSE